MKTFVYGAAAVAATVWLQGAGAAPINDWNLIVHGNLTSTSEVEGRTLVGGALSGTSNYGTKLTPANSFLNVDSLVVGGSVGSSNYQVNAGRARLAGTKGSANFNMNGGGALIQSDGSVSSTVSGAWASVTGTSAALQAMSATNTVTLPSGQPAGVVFNAVAGAGGIAVFNVNGNALFQSSLVQQMDINFNGASAVVINVTGTNIDYNGGNMVGNFNTANAGKIIWNFYQATTLGIDRHFFGAVLSPLANLTNSTAIEGSVFTNNFTQNGEVHLPTVTTQIPAPGSLALIGLGGLIAGRRRR
jgi:choice-of-anchor A domain-containing protein/uncharacterized protein (TIGR03382 family)